MGTGVGGIKSLDTLPLIDIVDGYFRIQSRWKYCTIQTTEQVMCFITLVMEHTKLRLSLRIQYKQTPKTLMVFWIARNFLGTSFKVGELMLCWAASMELFMDKVHLFLVGVATGGGNFDAALVLGYRCGSASLSFYWVHCGDECWMWNCRLIRDILPRYFP